MPLSTERPRLLVISHVFPFPGLVGQQQRVAYKLKALRPLFHTTFLTYAPQNEHRSLRERLLNHVDEAIILPARYRAPWLGRVWHQLRGRAYSLFTGLKFSNYMIGKVEFAPSRIRQAIDPGSFNLVLYEYWHAFKSAEVFRQVSIPTALDMHDVLWQSYQRQLDAKQLPIWWKRRQVSLYQQAEESAWHHYDYLIAINRAEGEYARTVVGPKKPILYAAMGADLALWPYSWQPADPPRLAYYGGLGSPHNQKDAMRCYDQVMPLVWKQCPQAELWIVGSNPPEQIRQLPERDNRVKVTGYVERVQPLLGTMTANLCPWTGTYGFRSRLVEVMALGVPVIASHDAVYGMDMEEGRGIFLRDDDGGMAAVAVEMIAHRAMANEQSKLARQEMQAKYSYAATYGKLAITLTDYCCKRL